MLAPTLALALLWQGTHDPDAALAERAAEMLLTAEERIADVFPRVRPWEALPGSSAAGVKTLTALDGSTMGAWTEALDQADIALVELDSFLLTPARRQDARALQGWIFSERQRLAASKPRFTDPTFYATGIERSLRALVPSAVATIGRAEVGTLTSRLEAVPGAYESARVALEWAPSIWVEEGAFALRGVRGFLAREGAAIAAIETLADEDRERYEAARAAAVEATARFEEWLVTRFRGSGRHPPVLPLGSFAALYERRFGVTVDIDELELRLLAAIGDRSAQIGERLEGEREAGDDPESEHALERLRPIVDSAFAWVAERAEKPPFAQVVTQTGAALDVTLRLDASPASALARARRTALDRWELELAYPDSTWPPGPRATRTAALSPVALRLHAVREGALGAALLRANAATSLSLSRARLPNDLRERAFGMYVAHHAARLEIVDAEDRAFASELARSELIEAARALAALKLHARHDGLETVAARFTMYTGSDEQSALLEISQAVRDPLHGAAWFVLEQTLALERAFEAENDSEPGAAVLATLGRLLASPTARIGDL